MIPVNTPRLNGNERKYLLECIDTGWISSEGPFIKRFEEEFSKAVNRKFGVAVCNGSAALDIAVQALDFCPGDEVIMPAFTIISPAASLIRQQVTPVLIDSDPLTWNMKVEDIEARVTPKTKAILVVHIYGLPVDMDPVLSIAKKYNLLVIEDAAEMHGQTYNGKPCGSFGDISIFSFYPNKHITTGEGGMVVTNSEVFAARCASLRNLCFRPEARFIHDEIGWNYRMTNMQAALGVAQLETLDDAIIRKREIGSRYHSRLAKLPGLQVPLTATAFAENIYWVFGIIVKNGKTEKDELVKYLNDKKIGTRPFFYPMHLQPVFQKMRLFNNEHYPVSEMIYEQGFYVPSGLGLTNDEIDTVCTAIEEFYAR